MPLTKPNQSDRYVAIDIKTGSVLQFGPNPDEVKAALTSCYGEEWTADDWSHVCIYALYGHAKVVPAPVIKWHLNPLSDVQP